MFPSVPFVYRLCSVKVFWFFGSRYLTSLVPNTFSSQRETQIDFVPMNTTREDVCYQIFLKLGQ